MYIAMIITREWDEADRKYYTNVGRMMECESMAAAADMCIEMADELYGHECSEFERLLISDGEAFTINIGQDEVTFDIGTLG